jgi:hypothetical protein
VVWRWARCGPTWTLSNAPPVTLEYNWTGIGAFAGAKVRLRSHDLTRSVNRMPRQLNPKPRISTTIMMFSRLLQLGHEPSRRQEAGLPPPPTMPFLRPYTFRSPSVVKVPPTVASGNQSENATITSSLTIIQLNHASYPEPCKSNMQHGLMPKFLCAPAPLHQHRKPRHPEA